MENEDLIFEDWKMTIDRIKHFDDLIFRLRLEGIPIAGAIIGIGLASFEYTSKIVFPIGDFTISATSIVILLGAVYLMPIFALDLVYYNLLIIAVNHAKDLEEKEFNGNLQIITQLTKPKLTIAHTITAIVIYVIVMITALAVAIAVNYLPTM